MNKPVKRKQAAATIESTPIKAAPVGEIVAPAPSSHQAIRQRAYELYEARLKCGAGGDCLSDWLRAEYELGACFSSHQPPANGEAPEAVPEILVPDRTFHIASARR